MNESHNFRTAVQHGVLATATLWVIVAAILYRNAVPERLITSWTAGNASEPTLTLAAFSGIFLGLVSGLGWLLLLLARNLPRPGLAHGVGAVAHGMALFLATLHVGILEANRTAVDGQVGFPTTWLLVALAAGALGGLVGWAVAPEGSSETPRVLEAAPLAIAPGEAVVWTGKAVASGWLLAIPALLAATALLLVFSAEPVAAAIVVGAGVLFTTMLRVHVVVGPRGMQVRGGPFGIVRTTVPLDDVTEVFAEDLDPLAYGGWGYRWLPGVRAITVRDGEALHVRRQDLPDLVVSVDDAPRGAGVLRAHLQARTSI